MAKVISGHSAAKNGMAMAIAAIPVAPPMIMFQILGYFVPRPIPGLCPWTPVGDFRPPDSCFPLSLCAVGFSYHFRPCKLTQITKQHPS